MPQQSFVFQNKVWHEICSFNFEIERKVTKIIWNFQIYMEILVIFLYFAISILQFVTKLLYLYGIERSY